MLYDGMTNDSVAAAEVATEPARLTTIGIGGPRQKRCPPLDLSVTSKQAAWPPLSLLAAARMIEDLDVVSYPEGIRRPNIELNVNAKPGRFRYDRPFLMQFMQICKDRPDRLGSLDAIGLEPPNHTAVELMSRGGSSRRSMRGLIPPPPDIGTQGPILSKAGVGTSVSPNMRTTEQSIEVSALDWSSMTSNPPVDTPFGVRSCLTVQPSNQGGANVTGKKRNRVRTKRGTNRAHLDSRPLDSPSFPSPLLEVDTMLSETSLGLKRSQDDISHEVCTLLDELITNPERFDSISDQIVLQANRSENERDICRFVYEKGINGPTSSEVCTRLCRKMMERISPGVRDEGIKNAQGKPLAGGQLFRKYLLSLCKEDSKRCWSRKESVYSSDPGNNEISDAASPSTELDAEQVGRRGLGLARFVGELFKLQMVTERILHDGYLKKLLSNVETPGKTEIESLCVLLTTVGRLLDKPKAHAHMDVYFARIKDLAKDAKVDRREQVMLQDVINLRERKWLPRDETSTLSLALTSPTTSHEGACTTVSSGMSRHTTDAVAGRRPPRTLLKAGDLNVFGKPIEDSLT
ncbi:ARM repeat-containing protein [Daedalea quercina L-15889]|uniref:ARM repeat-containing protein n=1 Tax=Daedalea quercina L-15889 TaxID=1314783 RepID=A0A165LU02_9APHY|nr:ARM repeat-containing protein [Daedalea quercina L-15889]